MDDQAALKRYLAEEMVEEYQEGRLSRRTMIKTVGQTLGVAIVGPALLTSLGDTAYAHGREAEADLPAIAHQRWGPVLHYYLEWLQSLPSSQGNELLPPCYQMLTAMAPAEVPT